VNHVYLGIGDEVIGVRGVGVNTRYIRATIGFRRGVWRFSVCGTRVQRLWAAGISNYGELEEGGEEEVKVSLGSGVMATEVSWISLLLEVQHRG
jgi:hypothetical protein